MGKRDIKMTGQLKGLTSHIVSFETSIAEKTASLKAAWDVDMTGRKQRISFRATLEGYQAL
jgi:hypothetical protein